jgi:hypothetical protein
MSDLPPQGLLQQAHARRVSGEHLEVLGKQAASRWTSGESKTLNDAVVETVKHAGLSPEQVKRVCEFANTDAYLSEFRKEGANHKFVDFGSGPASPAEVLKDLNDGGGGTVFDDGSHYELPPSEKRAEASEFLEEKLAEEICRPEVPMIQHEPLGEVMDLKDKLASACDLLSSEISELELQYADAADRVYQNVKQAALSGHELGEVIQVWQSVPSVTGDHVKVAFNLFTPRLLRELVFGNVDQIGESLMKTAEAGAVVNEAHPLVLDFHDFCQTLTKLAETRVARSEARTHLSTLVGFLKEASAGEFVGKGAKKVWDTAKGVSTFAGEQVGDALTHAGLPGVGGAVKTVLPYAPEAAAALEANKLRLEAEQHPGYHQMLSVVPGTEEYHQRWGR